MTIFVYVPVYLRMYIYSEMGVSFSKLLMKTTLNFIYVSGEGTLFNVLLLYSHFQRMEDKYRSPDLAGREGFLQREEKCPLISRT